LSKKNSYGRYYRRIKMEHPLRRVIYSTRSRAQRLGLEFNLKESDLSIPERCPILDIPLYFTEGVQTKNTPSIDRLDNTKGYTKDNIWIISLQANRMKTDAGRDELLKFAFWIYKTQMKKEQDIAN
jgi:hypothetical protein